MNNNPKVPEVPILTEQQSDVDARNGHTVSPRVALSRTTMAAVLMAAAIAALVLAGIAHSDRQAANAAPATAPSMASVPLSMPLDSGEVRFAFGYLEFEDFLVGGVPGLVALPPKSRAQ
jgi:hypothetical protein